MLPKKFLSIVKINIWDPAGPKSLGHVSLEASITEENVDAKKSIYVRFWPALEDDPKYESKIYVVEYLGNSYLRTYEYDKTIQRRPPDHVICLNSLRAEAIHQTYSQFIIDNKNLQWSLLGSVLAAIKYIIPGQVNTNNCAGVVLYCLSGGGLYEVLQCSKNLSSRRISWRYSSYLSSSISAIIMGYLAAAHTGIIIYLFVIILLQFTNLYTILPYSIKEYPKTINAILDGAFLSGALPCIMHFASRSTLISYFYREIIFESVNKIFYQFIFDNLNQANNLLWVYVSHSYTKGLIFSLAAIDILYEVPISLSGLLLGVARESAKIYLLGYLFSFEEGLFFILGYFVSTSFYYRYTDKISNSYPGYKVELCTNLFSASFCFIFSKILETYLILPRETSLFWGALNFLWMHSATELLISMQDSAFLKRKINSFNILSRLSFIALQASFYCICFCIQPLNLLALALANLIYIFIGLSLGAAVGWMIGIILVSPINIFFSSFISSAAEGDGLFTTPKGILTLASYAKEVEETNFRVATEGKRKSSSKALIKLATLITSVGLFAYQQTVNVECGSFQNCAKSLLHMG